MRVHAYIDGFNLYHGALKERPGCRWLDLRKLSAALLPSGFRLEEVRFYTARLPEGRKAQRQDVYLRALRGECAPFFYKSDVNLAVQLVADACDRRMDAALVVTDDSDLEDAMRMVREECGLYLIVASPRGHSGLAKSVKADLSKAVHENLLRRCQLPDPSIDDEGWEVFRPKPWSNP